MGIQTDRWPLDPIDRQSGVMFGRLVTLTFTGRMRVVLAAGATVRGILLAALGCNIAWGPVDAPVYLQTVATRRGQGPVQVAAFRAASNPEAKVPLRALMPGRQDKTMSDAQLGTAIGWIRDTRPGPDGESVLLRPDFIAAGRCLCW